MIQRRGLKCKKKRTSTFILRISLFFAAYSLLRLIISEENVIFYAWRVYLGLEKNIYMFGIGQTANSNSLVEKILMVSLYNSLYHRTRAWAAAEVSLFFEEHFYAFYMLHSISLNIFNNKPRNLACERLNWHTAQSVNETLLMIFYPLGFFSLYQPTNLLWSARKYLNKFLRILKRVSAHKFVVFFHIYK